MSDASPKITVTAKGPYLVSGSVPLEIQSMEPVEGGDSWEWRPGAKLEAKERYALCRCGESQTKPYCDGTHASIDFDYAETASRTPFAEAAAVIEGPAIDLLDDTSLCSFARFCDNHGRIWNLIEKTDDPAVAEIVRHEATHCPSGRLVARDKATGVAIEPLFGPSIVLVEDPAKACSGPIWVRGNVRIESQEGGPYETRNRVTLCRCGKSQNKPFCDGAHVDVAFQDGLA